MAALAVLIAACDTSRSIEQTVQTSDCTRCHGYPPPPYIAGGSNHPTSTNCNLCHPGTVEPDNVTIVPGGLHMDGIVEAGQAGHAIPYVTEHPAAAIADITGCQLCHGADYGGGQVGVSCNACHADTTTYPVLAPGFPDWKTNCTFCHGTRTAGVTTATPAAAPPKAVVSGGDQTRTNPKVGAHQAHLAGGTLAAPLPCSTCHNVPASAQALTHFSGGAAAMTFSTLAAQGVANPAYAGNGGTCAVYCHGSGTSWPSGSASTPPAWTTTGVTCTTCHGLPPSTGPSIGNPGQPAHAFHIGVGASCADCHHNYTGTTVDAAVHVNGTKDVVVVRASDSTLVTVTGWDCQTCHTAKNIPFASHTMPYLTQHTTDALAGIPACTGCHGADYGGDLNGIAPSCNACHADATTYPVLAPGFPDWKTNCTFCHGTRTADVTTATPLAAPPEAVVSGGDQTSTNPKVGAHQAHLAAGPYAAAFPCATCHTPPSSAQSLTHFTGSGATATMSFGALAAQGVTSPAYSAGSCAVYCHGSGTSWPTGSVAANQTPAWTSTGLACNACHASRPATGRHTNISNHSTAPCAFCHLGYVQDTTIDPALHVNGFRSVVFDNRGGGVTTLNSPGWANCAICHDAGSTGNVNAPPF